MKNYKATPYYAIIDNLGSVLKLVDNKVITKYEARYTPFGAHDSEEQPRLQLPPWLHDARASRPGCAHQR